MAYKKGEKLPKLRSKADKSFTVLRSLCRETVFVQILLYTDVNEVEFNGLPFAEIISSA
jgi:hypothetical protein